MRAKDCGHTPPCEEVGMKKIKKHRASGLRKQDHKLVDELIDVVNHLREQNELDIQFNSKTLVEYKKLEARIAELEHWRKELLDGEKRQDMPLVDLDAMKDTTKTSEAPATDEEIAAFIGPGYYTEGQPKQEECKHDVNWSMQLLSNPPKYGCKLCMRTETYEAWQEVFKQSVPDTSEVRDIKLAVRKRYFSKDIASPTELRWTIKILREFKTSEEARRAKRKIESILRGES